MLKRTALFEEHHRLGGRIVDFGGWELPVQYTGVLDEHLACRKAAGIFDVSHMGEFHVEGPGAESFLNWALTNDLSTLSDGQALYTVMCHDHGGIVDDLVVYRRAKDRFLVVVNASNTDKDFLHLTQLSENPYARALPPFQLTNESAHYSQIAVQGPLAVQIVEKVVGESLASLSTYWFKEGRALNSIPTVIARTGYTGEDGFELYVPWSEGPRIWKALLEFGTPLGLKPCGLGARDTLRLEMKYPLYGHELSDATHPLEAGLGWVVKMGKTDFVGREALSQAKSKGLHRKLVGIRVTGRGIPRQGYPLLSADGNRIGELTSGTQSPSLQEPIGVGYVAIEHSAIDTPLFVEIRGTRVPGVVVSTPFYKKQKSGG